jgi:hypothetical protein
VDRGGVGALQGHAVTHADVMAAIEARGGGLVASFVLDARGQTLGAPREGRKLHSCSGCGEPGHTLLRCNGPGNPPRPTYDQQRSAKVKRPREARPRFTRDSLDATRAILAAQREAKGRR